MGQIVFQATLGGQTTLIGQNTSSTFSLNLPLNNGNLVSTGDSGTVKNSMLVNSSITLGGTTISLGGSSSAISNDITIHGLTVGLGGGSISTNTSVGYQAGYGNTTGANNVFIGYQTGFSAVTGNANIGIGNQSLYSNTSGAFNTAIGGGYGSTAPLFSNTSGSYNTALGAGSLYLNTTSSNNTAIGYQAGYVTVGNSNTLIGYQAGNTITSGNNNICIGVSAQVGSASDTYEIVIGVSSTGKGSATGYINAGGGGVYQGNNSASWSVTSDQRLKKNIEDNATGLNKITQIRVRNFEYRLPEEITDVDSKQAIDKKGIQLGAIAQELQQVLPECVKQESTGIFTVDTDPLVWYLVNAVKELKFEIDLLKGIK